MLARKDPRMRGETMPRVLVQSDSGLGSEAVTLLQERVLPSDLDSEHFARQLVERISWVIGDARQAELEHGDDGVDREQGVELPRFARGPERSDAELQREPAMVG